jgi:ABC-type glycerol-3-phosphate transport system permease component
MFPGILFLLPLYLLFVYADQNLGTDLVGTRTGLIVTYLTFSLPFAVWMLVGYFETVPRDLDEAAKVDGAGPLRTLLQIIVPAATPGIVAVCIYAFMTAWGEVLFASVLTTDTDPHPGRGSAGLLHRGERLLEPGHGRLAGGVRPGGRRLPAAPALPHHRIHRRRGEVTVK